MGVVYRLTRNFPEPFRKIYPTTFKEFVEKLASVERRGDSIDVVLAVLDYSHMQESYYATLRPKGSVRVQFESEKPDPCLLLSAPSPEAWHMHARREFQRHLGILLDESYSVTSEERNLPPNIPEDSPFPHSGPQRPSL